MEKYNTKQKQIITELLKDNSNRSLTSDEILFMLNKKDNISKATLYRHLDLLVQNYEVRKFYNSKLGRSQYQYADLESTCSSHLHLRCSKCGKLIHLDCDETTKFINHINSNHGFRIDNLNTVINGVCSECQKKEK